MKLAVQLPGGCRPRPVRREVQRRAAQAVFKPIGPTSDQARLPERFAEAVERGR